MKTDLFQSCGHCWVFQICWHIECSTFTASSFRIWNSSAGIPSSPLALFTVMLPKAHLTSHSRMPGSRWVITSSWLSGLLRSFCTVLLCIHATSSYYLLLLFNPYHFCPLFAHLCMKCFLGISNIFAVASTLSHSIVFLYYFALITEEVFILLIMIMKFIMSIESSYAKKFVSVCSIYVYIAK